MGVSSLTHCVWADTSRECRLATEVVNDVAQKIAGWEKLKAHTGKKRRLDVAEKVTITLVLGFEPAGRGSSPSGHANNPTERLDEPYDRSGEQAGLSEARFV